jgi:hypothetical protein
VEEVEMGDDRAEILERLDRGEIKVTEAIELLKNEEV